ncbi:hypothetical protein OsJ_14526 [Oryza sativa Japonica Group]|uniref:Uncharacterized protein n=1 Tax=Oryza sativa subsp. japonica TaxID=39947 RepID=A3AT42_ORYSJ|nr:hypothetical protein OsJ_14526 [Oryza sativa Japonica Group]
MDDSGNMSVAKNNFKDVAEEIIGVAMKAVLNEVCDEVLGKADGEQVKDMGEIDREATNDVLGEGKEQEEIMMAANVKEVMLTPKRASSRLASMEDEHSLEKAGKRKAWKNLESCIDLGGSCSKISESVLNLRKIEEERSSESLKGSSTFNCNNLNNEGYGLEEEEELDNLVLGH